MAFGQRVVVTGGNRSCAPVQGEAPVTTALTPQHPFFCSSDYNIHTSAYSLRFVCVRFFFPFSCSSVVGKVSKPRRVRPLGESSYP